MPELIDATMNSYADKFPLNTLVIYWDDERTIGRYQGRMGLRCGSTLVLGQHAIKREIGGTIYVDGRDLRQLDFREAHLLGLDG